MKPFRHFVTEAITIAPGTYRVYHGTDKSFTSFRLNRRGEVHFTTDYDTAKSVGQARGGQGYVIHTDVTLRNPRKGTYGEDNARQLLKQGVDSVMFPHRRLGIENEKFDPKGFDCVVFDLGAIRIVNRERV